MRKLVGLALLFLFLTATGAAAATEEARLLRFPAIHGKQIVFTYAGDLYTVSSTGGTARRLTGHEGFEMFARFSPDGKWLAFTAQFDGNTEVYVMPSEGGVPKRLTYTATLGRDDVSDRMGPNNIVIGWKHDGKHIVFRSRLATFNDFIGKLYTVALDGGLPEELPLPRGGFCSFSPDDRKLVYNRVFREFRTWKRYRGGMADDLWVYDFETKKTENITQNEAQDVIPMWSGNRIYFLSDRDSNKRMNLYVYDLADHSTRRLTEYKDFDIKFPSLGDEAIVFENGGYIYRFDLKMEKAEHVPIYLQEDRPWARGGVVNVSKDVTSYEVSPDGKRALFSARGEVFTVPAQHGPTRNLTNTSGVHERNAKWSPDGQWIAFISDSSGEDEIYVLPQDGSTGPRQLTTAGDTYKYELAWSPNSQKIAWTDRKQRLQTVDVATKKVATVAEAKVFEIREFTWSPDSRWLAYAQPEADELSRVYLYSVEQGKSFEATDDWYAAGEPAFSSDGKFLFVVSDRDFNPTYSRTEFNHAYQDMARVYLITLAKDTPSPFKPKSDEVAPEAKAEAPKKEEVKKEVAVRVDVDGLKDRIVDLPIQASNYRLLTSAGGMLYYVRSGTRDSRPVLQMFDLAGLKETSLGPINGYEISADGKKMLAAKDSSYYILDLPKSPLNLSEPLKLDGMEMRLDRDQEWAQIFRECWRQMRDFFYDPDMHGVDWKALRARYEPLVHHVSHRADLTYVIGEMIGELNAGHCYVGGGEMPHASRVQMGLLGAQLRRDDKTGYYQVVKVLRGVNWDKRLRSPLAELGVDVKEGDYITAIDGKPTNEMANMFEALVDTAGKQVALKVNAEPNAAGSREVVVVPTASEAELYYYNWVQGNLKRVHDATGGEVGYIHVPDMLASGLNEFTKHYYPQLRRKALILDVRGNAGGNVSPMLIERLRREVAMIDIARNGAPHVDPDATIYGPKVCLMNEFSASDGDLFAYRFKTYKLGPLVGKRSWGGVVGIRGTLPLLDGSILNKPEFSRYDVAGKEWIIEGHGVDPDIVVDNDPAREYAGTDEQLEKAIAVIQNELKTKEKTVPPPPPYPKR